ncbi:MAG: NAD(P)H-binding protein [Halieaceae bacterium]
MKNVVVVGATGLVGSAFVRQALADYPDLNIHAVVRRSTQVQHARYQESVADTESWPQAIIDARPDAIFCALGTTIKDAGSKAAFRAVDFELVAAVGAAARQTKCRHFLSISSGMADASANSFYLQTKGAAEDTLIAQGFNRLDILRPGLLKGDRKQFRLGESLAIAASPLMDRLMLGPMKKFRSIHADTVAKAALNLLSEGDAGAFVHENNAIASLADSG